MVVKDAHRVPSERIELAEAGHPVPDARGVAASTRLLALAEAAGADDLVIVLISGGGSALTPAPAPPVTLEDKQAVTQLLLAAGATIGELNAVRKHLSRFKGGLLARAAWPATRARRWPLSDVIGDPLDVIASGPTAPDPTTLRRRARGARAPRRRARARPPRRAARCKPGARGDIPETPKPGDPRLRAREQSRHRQQCAGRGCGARGGRGAGLPRRRSLTLALEGEAARRRATIVARPGRAARPAARPLPRSPAGRRR